MHPSASNQEKGNHSKHVKWSKFARERIHRHQERVDEAAQMVPTPKVITQHRLERQKDVVVLIRAQRSGSSKRSWQSGRPQGEMESWRAYSHCPRRCLRPTGRRLLLLLTVQLMSPLGQTYMPVDMGPRKHSLPGLPAHLSQQRKSKGGVWGQTGEGPVRVIYEQVMVFTPLPLLRDVWACQSGARPRTVC